VLGVGCDKSSPDELSVVESPKIDQDAVQALFSGKNFDPHSDNVSTDLLKYLSIKTSLALQTTLKDEALKSYFVGRLTTANGHSVTLFSLLGGNPSFKDNFAKALLQTSNDAFKNYIDSGLIEQYRNLTPESLMLAYTKESNKHLVFATINTPAEVKNLRVIYDFDLNGKGDQAVGFFERTITFFGEAECMNAENILSISLGQSESEILREVGLRNYSFAVTVVSDPWKDDMKVTWKTTTVSPNDISVDWSTKRRWHSVWNFRRNDNVGAGDEAIFYYDEWKIEAYCRYHTENFDVFQRQNGPSPWEELY
jgi:hypothetical protein